MIPRWKIVIIDRTCFSRRPRTKKRRIIAKWRKRPENWRPLMIPVGIRIMMGEKAALSAYSKADSGESTYFDPANPNVPRIIEMHTDLWKLTKEKAPDFAKLCDVFRMQRRNKPWDEEVPATDLMA